MQQAASSNYQDYLALIEQVFCPMDNPLVQRDDRLKATLRRNPYIYSATEEANENLIKSGILNQPPIGTDRPIEALVLNQFSSTMNQRNELDKKVLYPNEDDEFQDMLDQIPSDDELDFENDLEMPIPPDSTQSAAAQS